MNTLAVSLEIDLFTPPAENELLNALSLTSYNLESLQQAARTGLLH